MKLAIRPQILNKIREENELTSDEQLAHHLGLTAGTIAGLRAGRTPSLPTLMKIADAARITRFDAAISKIPETLSA
ncbi:helix-turn-helix domain-containing protein [Corynebacterium doosanense]|uniref:HTH cro/C1-type domain-containing protein n=1 Tax=Corynebacterium doosanense CAU 212 = DSM 45436 TaxID=558173 RepID=A0A097IJ49_9CORY|nr:helix-turn-helix transcriptional regulator [Corynebacterium doosanense]AIT62166.1 hypothetical protein CDOO_01820 [Corynebacterium doosanense CAU 212 = DSM 45436]